MKLALRAAGQILVVSHGSSVSVWATPPVVEVTTEGGRATIVPTLEHVPFLIWTAYVAWPRRPLRLYAIVPTSWTNRAAGTSKLQLNEMGSRYLFIVLYVFLEDHLSRGDYRRPRHLCGGPGEGPDKPLHRQQSPAA